ncbi:hypothetical protein ACIGW4_34625 [Streptomyces sp. NPDC053513]|uniref:hypothetical protein n=1 Tax=unclassified Streptomyces TaxID=2593676 RepID=UPI0037D61845
MAVFGEVEDTVRPGQFQRSSDLAGQRADEKQTTGPAVSCDEFLEEGGVAEGDPRQVQGDPSGPCRAHDAECAVRAGL